MLLQSTIIIIRSFNGIKRRFEIQLQNEKTIYIDDYAHHPREIKVTIQATKQMYEGKKLTVVFQPHLYSRTQDFADDFAAHFDQLMVIVSQTIHKYSCYVNI